MPWSRQERITQLDSALNKMLEIFTLDPENAVRSQEFIQTFHNFIADDLRSFLTDRAINAGIKVIEEAKIFGSFKAKDVDVAVVHPINGPLIMIGVRSQMSSIGKNVLTYYQDIIGEAISLQERFPMSVAGYAYLHPYRVIPWEKKNGKMSLAESPNHPRYARLYEAIGQRDDRLYKHLTGSYDQFAYSVVDFEYLRNHSTPKSVLPIISNVLRDDIVKRAVPSLDMSILTFVPRLVETFHARNLWVQDIFETTDSERFPSDDSSNEEEYEDALL